jgi:hypothetical protein
MLLDIIKVTIQADFILLLELVNMERRGFNMTNFLDQKPWIQLKSGSVFEGVFIENGTVE